MPAVVPVNLDGRTALTEQLGESFGELRWHHRVRASRAEEDARALEIGQRLWLERNHRREQHRAPYQPGMLQEQAARDVGAIREASGNQTCEIEGILLRCSAHE